MIGKLKDFRPEIRRPPSSWRDVLDCKRPSWTHLMMAREAVNLFYDWFCLNDHLFLIVNDRDGIDYMETPWTAEAIGRGRMP